LFGCALVAAALSISAQQFLPDSIQFSGAPEYADKDVIAASGLKTHAVMTADEMYGYLKKLSDTGLFEKVGYNFDGKVLTISLTPSPQLFEVRLQNIPLAPETNVDAALHAKLPLYRGKVPSEGGMLDDVRKTIEDLLASEGIKATILAAPFTDLAQKKVTAMTFAETSPPVEVGDIQPDAGSASIDPRALALLPKVSGTAYDAEGSPREIATTLGDFYQDSGYLEVNVVAKQNAAPVIAPDAVRIPFVVSVTPGPRYKIAAMRLDPGMVVSQADFDKQSQIHPGDIADGVRVRENLHYLARQYHNKGYIQARVNATPTYDRAQGTVTYAVSADSGPQFTMGTLTIENVADDVRGLMYSAWKMPAGSVFNEGAILGFFATHEVNPKLERLFASVEVKYTLKPDPQTHIVDVVLRLDRKH
jgi:outer membrane protein insertion porin family